MALRLHEVTATSHAPVTEPDELWRSHSATSHSKHLILGGVYLTTAALVASGMGAWWISPIAGVMGAGSFALAFRRLNSQ